MVVSPFWKNNIPIIILDKFQVLLFSKDIDKFHSFMKFFVIFDEKFQLFLGGNALLIREIFIYFWQISVSCIWNMMHDDVMSPLRMLKGGNICSAWHIPPVENVYCFFYFPP